MADLKATDHAKAKNIIAIEYDVLGNAIGLVDEDGNLFVHDLADIDVLSYPHFIRSEQPRSFWKRIINWLIK